MAKNIEALKRSYEIKQQMIALKEERKALKYEIHKEELLKKKEKLEGDLAGINQSLKVGKIESQEDVKGPR